MSRPADDRHPIVREWMAFSAEHMRKVTASGDEDTLHFTLAVNGVRASLDGPLAIIIQANVDAVVERVRVEGNPSQAVGDAVLAGILFGVRLARKGLV